MLYFDWARVADDEWEHAQEVRRRVIDKFNRGLERRMIREGIRLEEERSCPRLGGWEEGRITVFVSDQQEPNPVLPDVQLTASAKCARIQYWNGTLYGKGGERTDEMVLHEMFHLFGFHHADYDKGLGYPMSQELTWSQSPTEGDWHALRCILDQRDRE